MTGLTKWTATNLTILSISSLCMIGCVSGKRGQMPAINDYNGPNADIHAENVRRFWKEEEPEKE